MTAHPQILTLKLPHQRIDFSQKILVKLGLKPRYIDNLGTILNKSVT